jgi:hypothetical protein
MCARADLIRVFATPPCILSRPPHRNEIVLPLSRDSRIGSYDDPGVGRSGSDRMAIPKLFRARSPLVGSDRDCSRLTGNSEVVKPDRFGRIDLVYGALYKI